MFAGLGAALFIVFQKGEQWLFLLFLPNTGANSASLHTYLNVAFLRKKKKTAEEKDLVLEVVA